jgi:hypothetical protein
MRIRANVVTGASEINSNGNKGRRKLSAGRRAERRLKGSRRYIREGNSGVRI